MDCDETFNYWEPLNLLIRGFGKQTWEYSPEFNIRSYAYLIPYFFTGKFCQLLNLNSVQIFYFIRIINLVGFTSYCEIKMFWTLNDLNLGNIANWFLFLSSINVGMNHAGVALLPSSLALQTVLLANSYILKSFKQDKESNLLKAVFWYFIGGILGWPFALALGLPLGIFVLIQIAYQKLNFTILFKIIGVLGLVITPIVIIDSILLQKLVFIPLNIVLYNVFGNEGEGPEIFGTEPFSYYVLNLLLNFNIVLPIAVVGILINPFIAKLKSFNWLLSSQLLIWFIIFGSQPHKEERFIYPIYSLIILSSSIFISKFFTILKKSIKLNKFIYYLLQFGFSFTVFLVSVLRILNLVENYSAPLKIFETVSQLPEPDNSDIINICMGKEWYHFPTSFFLPNQYRLNFVESGFDGLLPGNFHESGSLIDSITYIPKNMNNKNKFEKDKVIDLSDCDYFIDNNQLNSIPQLILPSLTVDKNWKLINHEKLINPDGKHNVIGKLIYIPPSLRKYIPYKVEYMEFCLLKRIKKDIDDQV
ncbi:ALG9 [Candida pseudojiufengensis]|uniref:ALG9 n=1 Tax=Candida pseudojiufengensis TaxID=497109 RepID=UPI002224130B|nr:ALG9 [Candida pseudojiufengensis]KAI5963819.1 ALG9 [Candida pseudojiufengensis]